MEFQDRVAVVTGGGSGIGRGLVIAFAEAGAKVVVADIDIDAANEVANEARLFGVDALAVAVDVSTLEQVEALRDRALEDFGRVNFVCNNAGVSIAARGVEASPSDWEWVLGVNLWGVIHGMAAFIPTMLASDEPGHIVNTSSMHGFVPSARSAMYSASKHAVVGLSDTYRAELVGTNVGISVLCPSAVTSQIQTAERNRPTKLGKNKSSAAFEPTLIYAMSPPADPIDVGHFVLESIRADRRYIFTDLAFRQDLERRQKQILDEMDFLARYEADRSHR